MPIACDCVCHQAPWPEKCVCCTYVDHDALKEALLWCYRHQASVIFTQHSGWDYLMLRTPLRAPEGEFDTARCLVQYPAHIFELLIELVDETRGRLNYS